MAGLPAPQRLLLHAILVAFPPQLLAHAGKAKGGVSMSVAPDAKVAEAEDPSEEAARARAGEARRAQAGAEVETPPGEGGDKKYAEAWQGLLQLSKAAGAGDGPGQEGTDDRQYGEAWQGLLQLGHPPGPLGKADEAAPRMQVEEEARKAGAGNPNKYQDTDYLPTSLKNRAAKERKNVCVRALRITALSDVIVPNYVVNWAWGNPKLFLELKDGRTRLEATGKSSTTNIGKWWNPRWKVYQPLERRESTEHALAMWWNSDKTDVSFEAEIKAEYGSESVSLGKVKKLSWFNSDKEMNRGDQSRKTAEFGCTNGIKLVAWFGRDPVCTRKCRGAGCL